MKAQTMMKKENNTRNGVNVEELFNTIDADIPQEQLEELVQLGPTYSPVFDSLTQGVPVSVELDK